jgi:hypothetical protein
VDKHVLRRLQAAQPGSRQYTVAARFSCCQFVVLQEQNMHLLQLPADALACVLSHVPQQQRLGSCSLVSRSMHAAAVAATGELLQNRIATQQKADSLCAWLRRHGSKALKQLDLGADCLAYATPSIGVSLPRVGLLQLRSLTLSNVKLSQYVSYLAAATSQQQNSNTSLTTAAASAAQPGSRGAVGTAAAALVTAGALPLASLTGLTSFSATQCSTNRGSFLGWAIINLPSLTALRQLHLKGCTVAATAAAAAVAATEGSAEFGAMLAQLQQLTSLKLQGMRLDGTALVTLSRLSNLQQLQAGCVGSSAAPLQLQHLPASLTVLDISHCHVAPWVSSSSSRSRSRSSSSSSSSSILQLDNLQELNVSSADGFSPAFAATARQLRVFTLDANALPRTSGNANGVVAALSNLQQMRYLCLSSVGTQDVSAAVSCAGLTASSHLEELLLLDCQLPEGAQQHMFVAGKRLHQLTHLWWGRWAEAGGGYSASEKQKALRELSRSDCFAIGPGDAARMASCCPALRDLSSLWADSSVLCGELQCLVQLTALTRLTVGGSGWDDAAAEAVLAHMTGGLGGVCL